MFLVISLGRELTFEGAVVNGSISHFLFPFPHLLFLFRPTQFLPLRKTAAQPESHIHGYWASRIVGLMKNS